MKRSALGRTGLTVPEIGFGCGPTAGLMVHGAPKERRAAVARALDLGLDYFDTAPVYGDTASEAHLGETLRALHAKPIVATKVALEAEHFGDIRGAVTRSVEASVARLGVPITLIQLHYRVGPQRAAKAEYGTGALLSVDDVLGPGGVVEAFGALRDRGLARFCGCSGYGGEPASVARLIDSGAFDTIIVNYSMNNRSAWAPGGVARDYGGVGKKAAASGMGVIGLRVLEGGALAEKAQEAVRFALSNRDIATVLIGFSDLAQIEAAATYAAGEKIVGNIR
ncbi:MAG TPA: aldo/keto reductase [Stellaceae bacterium]|jgi:L-galactose dehydrogenase/L-glyceraldehyde 3-phosphate reductase|nr:aldo/keto reductase [Stellaceae bacterium]